MCTVVSSISVPCRLEMKEELGLSVVRTSPYYKETICPVPSVDSRSGVFRMEITLEVLPDANASGNAAKDHYYYRVVLCAGCIILVLKSGPSVQAYKALQSPSHSRCLVFAPFSFWLWCRGLLLVIPNVFSRLAVRGCVEDAPFTSLKPANHPQPPRPHNRRVTPSAMLCLRGCLWHATPRASLWRPARRPWQKRAPVEQPTAVEPYTSRKRTRVEMNNGLVSQTRN